jgi:hypothetical protein
MQVNPVRDTMPVFTGLFVMCVALGSGATRPYFSHR